MDKNIEVSFIIPAFNEEQNIANVIEAVFTYANHLSMELIVVDNGSVDNTAMIIKNTDAKYIYFAEGNISAVRNEGVKASQGNLLVFIDADVLLTSSWQSAIDVVVVDLQSTPLQVTGSRCRVENEHTWLNRYWFRYLNKYHSNYINSGHLITSRLLFDAILGFNEQLQTAEDYDFCMRAQQAGAIIKERANLATIHLGYPKSIGDFIKRERWHGRQDVNSLQEFYQSKIACIALIILIQTSICFICTLLTLSPTPIFISIICTYGLAILLTIYKFRIFTLAVFPIALIFSIYLFARALAIVDKGLDLAIRFIKSFTLIHRGK